MKIVQFPQYRAYEDDRVKTNNAMMAILAGSRMASHMLSLTEGSTVELASIFPAVEHIGRFNLKSDEARQLLHTADAHIASVAIPYAIAVHEAFVTDLLEWMQGRGEYVGPPSASNVKAWQMHSLLFSACGQLEPEHQLQTFHMLRELRNCIIHNQGVADGRLRNQISAMGPVASSDWSRITRGQAPIDIIGTGGQLRLDATHIFAAFANIKELGQTVNQALTQFLSKEAWAGIAIVDFASSTSKTANSAQWARAASGYARYNYSAAKLSDKHLETAARNLGFWAGDIWR